MQARNRWMARAVKYAKYKNKYFSAATWKMKMNENRSNSFKKPKYVFKLIFVCIT